MPYDEPTRVISVRISNAQWDGLIEFLEGETPTEYVRRLIAEDLQANGIEWPDYQFIPNEKRGELGVPWRKKKEIDT